jgi:hypothetical protein
MEQQVIIPQLYTVFSETMGGFELMDTTAIQKVFAVDKPLRKTPFASSL